VRPRDPFTQIAYPPNDSENDAFGNGDTNYIAGKETVFLLRVQERISVEPFSCMRDIRDAQITSKYNN